jgi:L-alanine-DL-glutamate epimerase-like enolase superfamily enzyme
MADEPCIEDLSIAVYTVPTDAPESDGTLAWTDTTMVLVEVVAGDKRGMGYTYAAKAAGAVIEEKFKELIKGRNAFDISGSWQAMVHAARNLGIPGLVAMAISAVDNALWDLKGRLLGLPLAALLGRRREEIAIYGSGGFTSYGDRQLARQLEGWATQGIDRVKMKVGREPARDPHRMRVARDAIGPDVALFIDANGAHDRKGALRLADEAAAFDVRWLEEPVSSDDIAGLRLICARAPVTMEIAAGEYASRDGDFRALLVPPGAVDTLQADATRCLGITGFMSASTLAATFQTPLSAHCAPALHLHPCLAAQHAVHIEWFHDHARIEAMFFEGAPDPAGGRLADNGEPGFGLTLKRSDAERFRVA